MLNKILKKGMALGCALLLSFGKKKVNIARRVKTDFSARQRHKKY